ncbi:GIN domain-containing protein [Novosphingopyxis sp.]|uniref:GIN domain-containing protein n=1 Tax=Novosphingopyxis sp. TaxID=2709690 RepID=UPI003B597622
MLLRSCAAIALLCAVPACAINITDSAAERAFDTRGDRDPGPIETRDLDVSDFQSIELAGCDVVDVLFGLRFAVEVTGATRNLDTLSAKVSGETLKLRRTADSCNGNARGNRIAITMPTLRAVTISGAGQIAVAPLIEDRFEARLSGAGKLDMSGVQTIETRVFVDGASEVKLAAVDSDRIAFELSGAAEIDAEGQADQLAIQSTGASEIDTHALAAPTLAVSASGIAKVRARADRTAAITASGMATVKVTGGAVCTINSSGDADIFCS